MLKLLFTTCIFLTAFLGLPAVHNNRIVISGNVSYAALPAFPAGTSSKKVQQKSIPIIGKLRTFWRHRSDDDAWDKSFLLKLGLGVFLGGAALITQAVYLIIASTYLGGILLLVLGIAALLYGVILLLSAFKK